MSRIAAVATALYYPTVPRVASAISRQLVPAGRGGGAHTIRALDPCASTPAALTTIAQPLGAETYGVELHQQRAQEARTEVKAVALPGEKAIVAVAVPRSITVHHTRGRFLQRVGSRNLALSPASLRELFASRDGTFGPSATPSSADDQQAHLYEILWYQATLTLLDVAGHEALLEREQRMRFLQNDAVAIYDHAWGDGDKFAGYRITPGKVVDRFQVDDVLT